MTRNTKREQTELVRFGVLSIVRGNPGTRERGRGRKAEGWFVDQHALGLRAGDALHLAVASVKGETLHTLDERLAEAGPVLGVPTELLA